MLFTKRLCITVSIATVGYAIQKSTVPTETSWLVRCRSGSYGIFRADDAQCDGLYSMVSTIMYAAETRSPLDSSPLSLERESTLAGVETDRCTDAIASGFASES